MSDDPGLPAATAIAQDVLDRLELLEGQYYDAAFTLPFVATILSQCRAAFPEGGHVLLLGGPPLLAHCLLACGYTLSIYRQGDGSIDPALRDVVRGQFDPASWSGAALPFTDGPYAGAVLVQTLECLSEAPVAFLQALREYLADEGTVVLASVNQARMGIRVRMLLGRDSLPGGWQPARALAPGWPIVRQMRFYTADELRRTAEEAGFGAGMLQTTSLSRAHHTLHPLSPAGWLARSGRHTIGDALPGWRDALVLTLRALPRHDPLQADDPRYPFVSVIVPTHNRAEMLRDGMVNGLFQQTYPRDRWEIVLINDGSSDNTDAIVEELIPQSPVPINYIRLNGRGATVARNTGVEAARGVIVAHIDDDGRAPPGWIEGGVRAFGPGVAVVTGPVIPAPEERWGFFSYVPQMPTDRGLFPSANLMLRRDLAIAAGGFDESFGTNMQGRPMPGWDADLVYRILRRGYRYVFTSGMLSFSYPEYMGFRKWAISVARMQMLPEIVRRIPETRRGLAPVGGVIVEGMERAWWLLSFVGALLMLRIGPRALLLGLPWAWQMAQAFRGDLSNPRQLPKGVAKIGLLWLWQFGALFYLLYGSLRARRLLV